MLRSIGWPELLVLLVVLVPIAIVVIVLVVLAAVRGKTHRRPVREIASARNVERALRLRLSSAADAERNAASTLTA